MEHGPQLCNVGGKGDIRVEDDDPLQVGRQSLGQDQLHQTVNPRVMFVRDPGNFRLDRTAKRGRRKRKKNYVNVLHKHYK